MADDAARLPLSASEQQALGVGHVTSAPPLSDNKATAVRQRSQASEEMCKPFEMITALLGGTRTMRLKGQTFLPKFPAEEQASYDARVAMATLMPGFSRTVRVLASKPFSEPVTLSDDATPYIEELCENIDNQGRTLHVFCGALAQDALSYGLAGILVDAPVTDGLGQRADGQITQADEKANNIRPYFVHIKAKDMLGWKTKIQSGKCILTQLRILEMVSEDDGEFQEKRIEQVRVLEPGSWRTFRKSIGADGKEAWTEHKRGTTPLKYIPFAPVYGEYVSFMKSEPPMLDVAYMNVEHWQSKSDQQYILHVARVPILVMSGGDDNSAIIVGASNAVKIPVGGDLKFVEHTGKSIEAGRLGLDELEDDMRQAGAELLVIKPGNTSIPQTLADNEPGTCALQRITRDLNAAINEGLRMLCEWSKETTVPKAAVFDDFGMQSVAEAAGELLLKTQQSGVISKQTLFGELQDRGFIDGDITWDDEQARVVEEGGSMGGLPPGQTESVKQGIKASIVKRPDGLYVVDTATGDDLSGPHKTPEEAKAAFDKAEAAAP